ncbi:hypothetical protein DYU11_22650 [Fibrisoma montanum]|uniref:Uncharacterized protein n=1 Tax=Fibrisoma montanum TaxID=2305895 RepID=A0A418M1W9_9BACT|nr:hypothetical protein [Fibrisoma montanum]RIV19732.1 hypothetical protein DYU11_22650 [Fibrisoma montanum]
MIRTLLFWSTYGFHKFEISKEYPEYFVNYFVEFPAIPTAGTGIDLFEILINSGLNKPVDLRRKGEGKKESQLLTEELADIITGGLTWSIDYTAWSADENGIYLRCNLTAEHEES